MHFHIKTHDGERRVFTTNDGETRGQKGIWTPDSHHTQN